MQVFVSRSGKRSGEESTTFVDAARQAVFPALLRVPRTFGSVLGRRHSRASRNEKPENGTEEKQREQFHNSVENLVAFLKFVECGAGHHVCDGAAFHYLRDA